MRVTTLALVFGGLLVGSACRDGALPAGALRSADQSSQTDLAPAAPADTAPVAEGSQALQRLREAEATLQALEAVEARIEALEQRLAERAVASERAAQSLARLAAIQERRLASEQDPQRTADDEPRAIVLTNDDLYVYTIPPRPVHYERTVVYVPVPAPRREPIQRRPSSIQKWNDQLAEWRRERTSGMHWGFFPGYSPFVNTGHAPFINTFGDGHHRPGHRRDQLLPLVQPPPAPKPYVPPETFQSPRIQGCLNGGGTWVNGRCLN